MGCFSLLWFFQVTQQGHSATQQEHNEQLSKAGSVQGPGRMDEQSLASSSGCLWDSEHEQGVARMQENTGKDAQGPTAEPSTTDSGSIATLLGYLSQDRTS